MKAAALAIAALAVTACAPGPVRGVVRYTVRLEAGAPAGPFRVESAPGASRGWATIEQAFVRGCGDHQPYAYELERAVVTLDRAAPRFVMGGAVLNTVVLGVQSDGIGLNACP